MNGTTAPSSTTRRFWPWTLSFWSLVAIALAVTVVWGALFATHVSDTGNTYDCGYVGMYIVAPQKAGGGEGMAQQQRERDEACAQAFAGPVRAAKVAFWLAVVLDVLGVIATIVWSRARLRRRRMTSPRS